MQDIPPVIIARVLGHGLRLAPSEEGRQVLAREILDCNTDWELLAGLGHVYVYGMIRPLLPYAVYNQKGPTPSISNFQSPGPALDDTAREASYLLERSDATPRELQQLTLIRDNCACVFTGDLDYDTLGQEAAEAVFALNLDQSLTLTHVAHIISQSLSSGIRGMSDTAQRKFAWASTAAVVLECFSGFSALAILGEANLQSPLNVMTASDAPHTLFDRLDLWLVPAKDERGAVIPDTYDVCHGASLSPQQLRMFHIKEQISFRTATADGTIIC
ncbi:hypothetical protein DFP72DRAFT_1152120 [Ephemerocybe angulata]|uniref:Uncharacterized protein n=1 Tax=Ephemerocybe angulata TaxID=980116 RepID=A0A8H6HGK9_9AGAR|nr:hypothetical protein DFP72DRAFT_1152120 [Tulosesus angulatus]